jgi:hypothetical protein
MGVVRDIEERLIVESRGWLVFKEVLVEVTSEHL